ncbi:MAG: hypothetical protein IAF38_11915 [Bacteroidia bacterium]|nr:hypothetical protein [Bacteroidia bacterium]
MSIFSNQKTWFFIALFFIAVNLVLIFGFMRGHGHRQHRNFSENPHAQFEGRGNHKGPSFLHAAFIADTLGFSAEQKSKLEKMETTINLVKDSIFSESEKFKTAFSKELYSTNPDKVKLDSLSLCISNTMREFNRIRIEKVFQVRSICTTEQLEKFSAIMSAMSARKEHGFFNKKIN